MSLADLSVEKTASSPDRDRGRASRAAARPTRYRASPNGSSDPASMRIRRRHSRSSASSRAVSAAPSDAPVVAWLAPPGKTPREVSDITPRARRRRRRRGRPRGRPGTTARAPWRWPRSPSGRTRGARAPRATPGGSSRRRAGPRAARASRRAPPRARAASPPPFFCLRGEDLTLRLDARAHVGGRPRGRRGCPHRVRARARAFQSTPSVGATPLERLELSYARNASSSKRSAKSSFRALFSFFRRPPPRARASSKPNPTATLPSRPSRHGSCVPSNSSERGVRCVRSRSPRSR